MMNTLSCTVVRKLHRSELASAVGAKCLQLEIELTLHPRLDVLDGSRCMILGRNHNYPHVPAKIIHKEHTYYPLASSVRLDRTSHHAPAPGVVLPDTLPSPRTRCIVASRPSTPHTTAPLDLSPIGRTSSSRASFQRATMLMCPKRSCQCHAASLPRPRTAKPIIYVNFRWRRYKWFSSHFTFTSSTPPGF
jgi:hypothetical protein